MSPSTLFLADCTFAMGLPENNVTICLPGWNYLVQNSSPDKKFILLILESVIYLYPQFEYHTRTAYSNEEINFCLVLSGETLLEKIVIGIGLLNLSLTVFKPSSGQREYSCSGY